MSNGEVAVIKLRHHEKGSWLRKRRAEEEKSEDAPHLVEWERVKLEAEAGAGGRNLREEQHFPFADGSRGEGKVQQRSHSDWV